MLINPHVSEDDIYYVDEDGIWAKCYLEGFTDFYKESPDDKLWTIDPIPAEDGPLYFSFDRRTIYNFWGDYDKLTDEQKMIFREWNPVMVALKEGHVDQ